MNLPSYSDLLSIYIFNALEYEIAERADAGKPLSAAAISVLRADLQDSTSQADPERLAALWHGLPALADELMSFEKERGWLPG